MEKLRVFAFADEASPAISGQIAAMERNGLQGLEIRGVDGENVSDISLDKAREVRRRLEDAGLTVWSVGSNLTGSSLWPTRCPAKREWWLLIRSSIPVFWYWCPRRLL